MNLEPAKHEKVARSGRISSVFRIVRARSAKQSVGIMALKGAAFRCHQNAPNKKGALMRILLV